MNCGPLSEIRGIVESKLFEDLVEEKSGHPSCVDGFVARSENHPLTKSMVDYDH